MNVRQRAHFIGCYARLVDRSWDDGEFFARLQATPATVLTENGLTLRASANITVMRLAGRSPDVAMQIALWEDGDYTGNYVLHLPAVEARALTDSELDRFTGGLTLGDVCRCAWCSPRL